MSLLRSYLYEFGGFCLDTKERTLICGSETVDLTPKAFELLSVLVEHHGKLLEKAELMQSVWADSFVEESNLTFNIRQLRKLLGDDAQHPKFIKTVPRHGYRFIANVTVKVAAESVVAEVIPDDEPAEVVSIDAAIKDGPAKSGTAGKILQRIFRPSVFAPLLMTAVVITLVSGTTWIWSGVKQSPERTLPIFAKKMSSKQLTATGGVFQAVISPNGKKMAYSSEIGGKQGIWIKELGTSENVQIVSNSDEFYYGLNFSHDGEMIYFARGRNPSDLKNVSIYRVSAIGGVPKEVVARAEGDFSLSPDDRQISFVRCTYADNDYCSLFVADVEGKSEYRLVTRERPTVIGDSQFSPDGSSIAFAEGHSRNDARAFGVSEVNVDTRDVRPIVPPSFFQIAHLRWLPDQSGLLATVFEEFYRPKQVFYISPGSGEVRPLTSDSINYNQISLDQNAERMVATQYSPDFRLFISPADNTAAATAISTAFSDFVFTPSGKLVYSSTTDGNLQLWIMNADGTGQRQLTSEKGGNWHPIVSDDERFIFFTSNRLGSGQVWRMNVDGTDQTVITKDEGGKPIFASADGNSVYYETSISANLRKVTIHSDADISVETVVQQRIYRSTVDANENNLAYFSRREDGRYELSVRSLRDSAVPKTFVPANAETKPSAIFWSNDGTSFFYVTRENGSNIVWEQRLNNDAPTKFADLGPDIVSDIALSSDQRSLAFIRGRWNHDAVLLEGLD